jgi:hypothetical protein
MTVPVLPIRRQRTERIETRTNIALPPAILEIVSDLNTRLLRQAAEIAELQGAISQMKPMVDLAAPVAKAIVDYAQETRGAA